MHPGWIGGIVGAAIGVIGGLIGAFLSIRNTRGPRERRTAILLSALLWFAIATFFVAYLAVPPVWRPFLWAPWSIVLTLGLVFGNRWMERIRGEERRSRSKP